jgi:uncharacterized membrane protein
MLWRTRQRVREARAGSIWPIPVAIALGATYVADLSLLIDDATVGNAPDFSPATATAVLAAIAGAMITFTGFVFSVLLLVVQFASGQFTPRVLRLAYRDRLTQTALGVFTGTFLFALYILGEVGSDRVPTFSLSLAVLFVLTSVIVFIALVNRVAQRMRATAIADTVAEEGLRSIARTYPEPVDEDRDEAGDPSPRPTADELVTAGRPGVIRAVNERGLVALARSQGVEIEMRLGVGDFVTPGAPLFGVRGGTLGDKRLRKTVVLRGDRAIATDPMFALRVLSDIACKALSPGVNDPTTAVQALDRTQVLLVDLAARRLPGPERRDADGVVRLRIPSPTWADVLELGVGEVHHYGRGSVQVVRRLRALLVDLLEVCPDGPRREAVLPHLERLERAAREDFTDPRDAVEAAAADWQGLGLARAPGTPHAG